MHELAILSAYISYISLVLILECFRVSQDLIAMVFIVLLSRDQNLLEIFRLPVSELIDAYGV